MADTPKKPEGDVTDKSFAADVLAVYDYINVAYGSKKPGYSESRKFLHDWATFSKEDGSQPNVDKFMKMVLDAEKSVKSTNTSPLAVKSKKQIDELRRMLRDTIAASKEIQP